MILFMKNILTIAIFIFTTFNALSQKATTHELEKFTEVKVFDRIEVTLIKSNENKIVITGEDRDDVVVSNTKGLLKVRMEFENQMDGGDVVAKLYYSETLTLIDSNEGAKILSTDTFKTDALRIAVQEGGKVIMKVDADELDLKSTSGAEITLTGNAKTQKALANSGGKVYNKKLNTQNTEITVNAGGRADVKASDKVIAKVRAGGSIYIYGNPKEVDSNKVFGGKIEVVD